MNKNPRTTELLTGLFVLVALVLLLFGALWIAGADPLGRERSTYEVWMADAGGVRAGEQVRMAGVEVGRVEEVVLRPGDEWPVIFRISIRSDIPLMAGTSARFASDGLLGAKFLALEAGPKEGVPLTVGQPIHGDVGPGLDQALARLDELAKQATQLLGDASETVTTLRDRTEPLLERFETLVSEENVAEASDLLRNLNRTVEEVGPRLQPMVDRLEAAANELEKGAGEVPELSAEVKGLTQDLRQALGAEGERLASVLDAAEKALGSADGALQVVEGSSDELESTLRDLREAVRHLKSFGRQVDEQPSRVLRSKPPADRKPGEGVQ